MDQSHQNEAKPSVSTQNVHVDPNPATTSDLVASSHSRKRTASDASINKNQTNEHQQSSLDVHVPNADGVPSTKTRKIEVTQSQSKHDIVTSTPKPNPCALPIYSINHASTTQLSPIQNQSLPLSGFPHNSFANIVKMLEDVHKFVLRYSDDQNMPSMPYKTAENSSEQIIDQSLCDAQGRNGGVPVAEDVIVISGSDNSNIGTSVPTNIKTKARKNNQTIWRQQQKTKDSKKDIPISDCPICLEALDNKPTSCTICGHIFCTPCIEKIIKSKKDCPTCRTRLGKKKIHPLFI